VKITPLDIRRKEFKRGVRGYSDEEVDIFLDEVADEFERLFQENMELQDRSQRLEEQIASHAQIKDALEKTLISAQLQSEEIRSNAHKERELILRDAQLKARGIVDDSYGETQRLQQSLVQLKRLDEEFRFKFRSLLEGYLNLLNQAPITTEGPNAAALETAAAALAVESVPVYGRPEDEVPTEENEAATAGVSAVAEASALAEARRAIIDQVAAEEVTAESPMPQLRPAEAQQAPGDESLRGFFFGRQEQDIDDTFQGDDAANKDKARDFEW
jgi:cell division initiation protein